MTSPLRATTAAPAASSSLIFQFIVESNVDEVLAALDYSMSPRNLAFWMQAYVVDQHFQNEIRERFRREGSESVGSWKPLSEATVHIREELGYGGAHPINVRTGELQKFVTSNSDIFFDADQVVAMIPGEVDDPITERKLSTAQKGSSDNPLPGMGPTPPRPVLSIDTEDVATLLTSLQYAIIANVQFVTGVSGT